MSAAASPSQRLLCPFLLDLVTSAVVCACPQRLREICDKHGLLLIFDEVITGFGRLGKGFGADYFDVVPDMITCAKGLTNAAVPGPSPALSSSSAAAAATVAATAASFFLTSKLVVRALH
jgi:adenosylmethionine-8-amino-7-oxononanoate aminotransferase